VQQPSTSSYPASVNSPARRALYDNLEQNEVLALSIDEAVRTTKKDSWRGNLIKERQIKYAVLQHLKDPARLDDLFELIRNQAEY
jgi:type I restriction enzyme R subunit